MSDLDHEALRRIAFLLWEAEGRPEGSAERHWREAEAMTLGASGAGGEIARDAADREPGTLADDDDVYADVASVPMSDRMAIDTASGDDETVDGLDDLDEAVRQQTEDTATGAREDYQP